eukprot:5824504-Prymnesium_polylepis.1
MHALTPVSRSRQVLPPGPRAPPSAIGHAGGLRMGSASRTPTLIFVSRRASARPAALWLQKSLLTNS